MFNLEAFWINMSAGAIYFIFGIFLSIWLIPNFTVRLINRRNRKYFRKKIAFLISEICSFFNNMPQEFITNRDTSYFYVSNKKYPDIKDFIAILRPNLFKPVAIEETMVLILGSIKKYKSDKRHELVKSELDRFAGLMSTLENVIGIHSLNFTDNLIQPISSLCLDIRIMQNEFKFNEEYEKLTGKKEGLAGAVELKKNYERLFEILKSLSQENGILRTEKELY